ncbi:hypothetical protein [Novosphingobium sp. P6W]|uniref:hypothetical protein n=1 Tax=Novosphingobium sp. P6W TaxID=1609758 RepID=UPI0005C2F153|nr:hypothetical protein [Novosphingobium sp. P6W]AXB79779.1 hypothetical protein TQ38_025500 [Novosphingobium sp. P6W]KIS30654.1 hypothetical protein TQ38_21280 [Novosphingobium sp. P6W]
MRGVVVILLLWLAMPAASWAQSTIPDPEPYSAAKGSIQQAVANSIEANFNRRMVEDFKKAPTLEKVKAYLNQPAFKLDSWLRVGQALGLPVGTKLVPPGLNKDSKFCQANPSNAACLAFANGGDYGGGGSGGPVGSWECGELNYNLDVGGNVLVPALELPDPIPYKFGQGLYRSYVGGNYFVTNEPWSAFKVGLHMANGPKAEVLRKAPVYASQYCAGPTCQFTVYTSSPAYYNGATRVNADYANFSVSTYSVGTAWSQDPGYGPIPKQDYVCEDGIGIGNWNQHAQMCVKQPAAWSIPSYGVVPAADLNKWSLGSSQSFCPISDEFIRQIADRAYKAACGNGECEIPYERIEKEDVRTGGQQPTVRDTANVGELPTPNDTPGQPGTTPTDTPTDTPTEGPDWTNPGTAAPNPQSPTAQSIIDKAFDWGFPEISINLGSPSCPTYSAEFYEHTLVLDSHCPFIEQNRAIISAMMILFFTIAAGMIVLKA